MAVEIKSGNSTDLATVDPVSKAFRFTQYRSNGTEVVDQAPETIAVGDVTVVDNDLIASFDAGNYSYVSLQLSGTWVGTVQAEASNNNGTWKKIVVQNTGDKAEPYITNSTTNSIIKIPILAKYLRVRVIAFTSGIVEGTAFGYREDIHTGQISATGEVSIVAASGTPSQFKFSNIAGTNAQVIKASAGNIRMLWISSSAALRYFKLYDQSTTPVVGTDIPKYTFSLGAGANSVPVPAGGFVFDNGISMACLLSAGDSGTTPFTVLNEVGAMIEYI